MAIKQISAYPTITPGEYDERTGRYENVGIDDTGWNWDENTGKTTKIDPNFQAPSQFSLEDIKNRSGYAFDPYQDKLVSDSADASLDPSAYYNQLAKDLSEASYGQWSINGDASQYQNLIESLKEVDPKAYYTAKIDTLSRGVGHQYQSNQMDRGDVVKQQLQDLLPEAQKAGLTPEEISNLFQTGYSSGAKGFSQILQGQQSAGGPYTPLWEGLKFVGPGALGMYGIDQALIAGLGAGYGAATGMSTYGIGSGLGTAAELSGALASGAGSLGSGALGAGAIASEAGQAAFFDALAKGATSAEALNTGLSLEALGTTATQALPYTETNDVARLFQSGITDPGQLADIMSATGMDSYLATDLGRLAAQGLSESQMATILAASYTPAELAGTGIESLKWGSTATTALSTADKLAKALKTGADLLKKKPSGVSPADSIFGGDGSSIPGIRGSYIKLNENPFTFGNQSPLTASAYDVSGGNSMANALRKRT
jgi:hypothetical protein